MQAEKMVDRCGRRGRIRAVVIAGHQQHAAVPGRAGVVHMLEDIAATVHAGTLAVPHGEHAIVLGRTDQIHLLRAPDGGRRQILVHTRHELDMVRFQVLLRFPQRLLFEAAQWPNRGNPEMKPAVFKPAA